MVDNFDRGPLITYVNDRNKAQSVQGEQTKNPILAQASATANSGGQNTDTSKPPGILSKDGRVLTLTFPNNTNTTLKINDCIEFEKDGKQQSGKIVHFYRSSFTNAFVDVIFIDLWDEFQNDYIPKETKIGVTNTNVLDSFRSQDNPRQQNIILSKQSRFIPEGIALTPLYSGNNAYNDAGVWKTIIHCNAFGKPAQKIFNQDAAKNINNADALTAQFESEIEKRTNQGGGSKSKTLKKKQQNIKIRLV